MRSLDPVQTLAACATLFVSMSLPAQAPAAAPSVPTAILNAKSVFISNAGSDGGLYPEPFTGDANRPFFSFAAALQSAHKYVLVEDPTQADLVMEIHLLAPTGPQHTSKQLGAADFLPFFRLTIYDSKSHFVLWTITEPIEFAILQKTHNKNFDDGIARLVDDVQALAQPSGASLYPHPPVRQSPWMR